MSKTTNFDLDLMEGLVDPAKLNGDLATIDEEMAKPPLTVNGVHPDPTTRNIPITTVPLANNLVSDESQVATGDFILRSSGGDASIATGTANLSSIMGNAVKTGYVAEFISLEVIPIDPTDPEAITASYDRDTIVGYMESSGTVTFTYASDWTPSIAPYGITVSGTPSAGDQLVLNYTKGNRGTISIPNPVKFCSTGWNLYNHTAGYARVPKYSDNYGFMIEGSYTTLKFATTQTGAKTTITPVSGHFTIPNDGYLFVTGGNATNTAIYMTWGDWTDGTPEDFEAYTQEEIDLSGVMVNFPNGLMRVGDVADEINFNTQLAISKINRIAYTEENLESVIASGLAYDTDQNYIYHVRSEFTTYSIDIDGSYNANDHGTEFFTGVTIPVYATIIYGQDLAGKLRRDVVTISPMDLSPEQQAQIRQSIGVPSPSEVLNGLYKYEYYKIINGDNISGGSFKQYTVAMPQIAGYTAVGIVSWAITGANATYSNVFKLYYKAGDQTISVGVRNLNTGTSSSAVLNLVLEVWVLYLKNPT